MLLILGCLILMQLSILFFCCFIIFLLCCFFFFCFLKKNMSHILDIKKNKETNQSISYNLLNNDNNNKYTIKSKLKIFLENIYQT